MLFFSLKEIGVGGPSLAQLGTEVPQKPFISISALCCPWLVP